MIGRLYPDARSGRDPCLASDPAGRSRDASGLPFAPRAGELLMFRGVAPDRRASASPRAWSAALRARMLLQMTDALTSRLRTLLGQVIRRCDCPRCDVGEYQKLLDEHLFEVGTIYRPEHLRAAWEKPTPRPTRPEGG